MGEITRIARETYRAHLGLRGTPKIPRLGNQTLGYRETKVKHAQNTCEHGHRLHNTFEQRESLAWQLGLTEKLNSGCA